MLKDLFITLNEWRREIFGLTRNEHIDIFEEVMRETKDADIETGNTIELEYIPIEITIFLRNGSTLRFEHCTSASDCGEQLDFSYISASTGKKKHAYFDFRQISGYSVEIL